MMMNFLKMRMLVTREKFTQETNGNDNISIVTVSRQNGGIFKIPIAFFHYVGLGPNQNR